MSLTTSAHWMYNSGGAFYDHEIDNSLRFNDNDSAYLSRTPASSGDQQKWTFSAWVKRANITLGSANHQTLFSCATTNTQIRFHSSDDTLDVLFGGSASGHLRTSQVFRDVGSWYHIVVAVDTTQATASNRAKIYINGNQVTAFGTSTYPAQNYNTGINTTQAHNIGRSAFDANRLLDGYFAEINHIDGTALDPTSFGETKSGVWIPKAYSGSYGTNGFHLEFAGNTNDTSGNGNNYTANNISSYDYVPDTPTNSFCTLVPAANVTESEGNLKVATSRTSNWDGSIGTIGVSSGKWYYEARFDVNSGDSFRCVAGWIAESAEQNYVFDGKGTGADPNPYLTYQYAFAAWLEKYYANGGSTGTAPTASDLDIVNVAIDFDNNKAYFGLNGTYYASDGGADGDPANGLNESVTIASDVGQYNPYFMIRSDSTTGSNVITMNFGQDSTFAGATTAGGNADGNGYGDFKYAPPSGFLALCSANLPDPAIDPAADDTPTDYFDTILYTAATSNGTYTHGNLSFQPDFSWIKNRNNVEEHYLIDVVRDNTSVTNTFLRSNNTAAEGAGGVSGTTFSVTSTGYEFVETSINSGELYFNGRTYVGWNWKAGGTAVSNTDGSITSSVSANTDAGFSVLTYSPSGSSGSVGHGLGVTPDAVIVKRTDASGNWVSHWPAISGTNKQLYLNLTNSVDTNNISSLTSTTFSVSGWNDVATAGGSYVAYCFADIDGFSKAGSYVGNGSSDGPMIFTGFRPAWVMIKRTDTSNAYTDWFIFDVKRHTYNDGNADPFLEANTSSAEQTALNLDILSSGFKPRDSSQAWNASGGSYIYLAFAEQPFKYANAR